MALFNQLFMQKIFVVVVLALLGNYITVSAQLISIETDKAIYKPGEKVTFHITCPPANLHARYYHLSRVIGKEIIKDTTWTWSPPPDNFTGYLVEIFKKNPNHDSLVATIAVDVSSDWSKFPRYGFLSHFDSKTKKDMDAVINNLNRHHINGIQFYDWMDKHHQPLAGTPQNPAAQWKDIANRDTYKHTIDGYISRAHDKGMMAMFYNLCYGALTGCYLDGVKDEWIMYRDSVHKKMDMYDLPEPMFKSDIYFIDPSNKDWQQYLVSKNKDVYSVYDFDGFHIDQVGNRDGRLYTFKGDTIDLPAGFKSFITSMKIAEPSKKLVFNAVNQYGQKGNIAKSPVDFLYTEAWNGNEEYKDLARIIRDNYHFSNGKSTILAAYLNYNKASSEGPFNTPGVLLADAVIFAFGGAHIELGEHMLGKEYFPNNNLSMDSTLQSSLVNYYDFMTAYENLLRVGGNFNKIEITCTKSKMDLDHWPAGPGKVAVQSKLVGNKQVIHLLNFTGNTHMNWRDTDGTKPVPPLIRGAELSVKYSGKATKVWLASPDSNGGKPESLSFKQMGDTITFTVPAIAYWDMIVIEK
jgi:dextranase